MRMTLIKPPPLKKGDRVGIISPSWCGAGNFPHRLKRGISFLETLGLNPVLGSHVTSIIRGKVTGAPEERAQDVNQMFADKKIRAIFVTIGGVYCNELLPFLDFDLIKKNPKIIVGYSDVTSLLLAIYTQAGLITFYGPMVMTQMAEHPQVLRYTLKYFKKALFSPLPIGLIKSSSQWTDEWLEWKTKKDLTRARKLKRGGWKWLRKGKAEGKLLGGCLNALLRLKGTLFFPDFDQAIFFWEVPKEVGPEYVDLMLTDFGLTGVFSKISGMIVGRPPQYSKKNLKDFEANILKRTASYNFPILGHTAIGHTDPILTLPLGTIAELNSRSNKFYINLPNLSYFSNHLNFMLKSIQ